jgi:hypothetical protein
MSLSTYWTFVAPLLLVGAGAAILSFTLFTSRGKLWTRPEEDDALRAQAVEILFRQAAEAKAKARAYMARARALEAEQKRRSGEEPDLFWKPPAASG